jgi:hypothetical protein
MLALNVLILLAPTNARRKSLTNDLTMRRRETFLSQARADRGAKCGQGERGQKPIGGID